MTPGVKAAPLMLSQLLGLLLAVPTCVLARSLRAPPPEAGAAVRTARELELDLSDLPFEVLDAQGGFAGIDTGIGSNNQSRGRKPVIWVHIHKAAGSFMCAMAKAAGERVVKPNDNNCNWNLHDRYGTSGDERNAAGCPERRDYFQSNRFTYGQVERELYPSELRCGGDFNYGVFLREPVDLMLSTLNYNAALYDGEGRGVLTELRRRLSLSSPQPGGPDQKPEWKTLDNFQTRLLANAWDVPAGRLTQEHLARARQTLEGFQVVARVEDLPSRGAVLFEALGWPSQMAGRIRQKVNKVTHDTVEFAPDEVAWLREVNKMDIQLYNEVSGRPYQSMVY